MPYELNLIECKQYTSQLCFKIYLQVQIFEGMSFMIDERAQIINYQPQKLKILASGIVSKLKTVYKQIIKVVLTSKNTCQIIMPSVYQEFFFINLRITMNNEHNGFYFNPKFQITISVDYPHLQTIKYGQKLAKKLKLFKQEQKQIMTLIFDENEKNRIHFTEKINFKQIENIQFYAHEIQKKMRYIKNVCNKMTQLYKKDCMAKQNQLNNVEQSSISEEIMESYRNLLLVSKQQKDYKYYFTQEAKGGFVKNPGFVMSTNQLTRNITIEIESINDQKIFSKQEGSYSRISFIECMGQKDNTIIQNRKGGQSIPYNPDPSQDRVPLRLICKKRLTEGKQKQIADAAQSFQNEVQFLTNNAGLKCPFINNHYWEMKKSKNNIYYGDKQKILSDYQRLGSHHIFDEKFRAFTMSDIINFIQQLLMALKNFYLDAGFLHRDIKFLNIMISDDGVIKIIDHGSVYPYDNQQELRNPLHKQKIDALRAQYHSKLRSSLYVDKAVFKSYKQRGYLKDYETFEKYNQEANTHKTYDVYSVGMILDYIVQTYLRQISREWMQVSHLLKGFIMKLLEPVPSKRIEVQQALVEISKIRSKLFQNF